MLGTIVNSVAIIIGSSIGLLFKKGIKENYKETIMNGLGLAVIVLGFMNVLESQNIGIVIICLLIGSIIGEWINIENKLNNLGLKIQSLLNYKDSNFVKGFVNATMIYCIGAMGIVGSLQSGLTGNHETLFSKSILDGVSAIIFSSTFGIGVLFSSISVFLYQGFITILSSSLKTILVGDVIIELSALGGILIIAIGVNVLEIKKIRVANMLPSLIIILIYYTLNL